MLPCMLSERLMNLALRLRRLRSRADRPSMLSSSSVAWVLLAVSASARCAAVWPGPRPPGLSSPTSSSPSSESVSMMPSISGVTPAPG
eukprot:366113-Chlamydomonas_euryale.AAC.4